MIIKQKKRLTQQILNNILIYNSEINKMSKFDLDSFLIKYKPKK